jgi:hypothetical protein
VSIARAQSAAVEPPFESDGLALKGVIAGLEKYAAEREAR